MGNCNVGSISSSANENFPFSFLEQTIKMPLLCPAPMQNGDECTFLMGTVLK